MLYLLQVADYFISSEIETVSQSCDSYLLNQNFLNPEISFHCVIVGSSLDSNRKA